MILGKPLTAILSSVSSTPDRISLHSSANGGNKAKLTLHFLSPFTTIHTHLIVANFPIDLVTQPVPLTHLNNLNLTSIVGSDFERDKSRRSATAIPIFKHTLIQTQRQGNQCTSSSSPPPPPPF